MDVKKELDKAGGRRKSELVDSKGEVSVKLNSIESELKEPK